jgi:hypothetical protein
VKIVEILPSSFKTTNISMVSLPFPCRQGGPGGWIYRNRLNFMIE